MPKMMPKLMQLRLLALAGVLSFFTGPAGAVMYDLTTPGYDPVSAKAGGEGRAFFDAYFEQPVVAAYVDPFVLAKQSGAPGTPCNRGATERCPQGARTLGIDRSASTAAASGKPDRWAMLGDVPEVIAEGAEYPEFLFDIDRGRRAGNRAPLFMDALRFFVSGNPAVTHYDGSGDRPGTMHLVARRINAFYGGPAGLAIFDWLSLDTCKAFGECGSGDPELKAPLPGEVFGIDPENHLVVFNRFGDNAGATNGNGGFEVWIDRTAVPDSGSP